MSYSNHKNVDVLPQFIKEIADELNCKPDNDAILQAIDDLRVAAGAHEAVARSDSKSRSIPEALIDQVCLNAAEIHNRGVGVNDEKAQAIIDRIRNILRK